MEIPTSDDLKNLGVPVDSKLRWHNYLSNVVAKGNSTLGFIRRNVTTTSEKVKSLAYKPLVRPVGYLSMPWDALTQTQETSLESGASEEQIENKCVRTCSTTWMGETR